MGNGLMYGAGVYFAESTGKADEYARFEEDCYCMILTRVALGRVLYTADIRPRGIELEQMCCDGKFDSVLGDRMAAVGTYREFISYREDVCYPAYIVCYRRLVKM